MSAFADGGSLRSPRLRILPPQGGKGSTLWGHWVRLLLIALIFVLPSAAHALDLTGNLTQGGFVTGRTTPGAKVLLGDRPLMVGEDGLFVFGFARDQAPHAQLTIIHPDSTTELQMLDVAQRTFDIQRIDNLQQSKVTPNPADLARIKADQEKINAVRGGALTQAQDFLVPFIWPAQGPISGVYGSQRILNGEPRAPHYGLDIAAPEGSPVVAPAPGIVRLVATDFFLTGGTIILDHGFGVQSAFIHMKALQAKVGTYVKQGEVIGHVGKTGRATGPHLHWGMTWLDVRLDPAFWVPPQQAQN
jgi:Peptidase family M23